MVTVLPVVEGYRTRLTGLLDPFLYTTLSFYPLWVESADSQIRVEKGEARFNNPVSVRLGFPWLIVL